VPLVSGGSIVIDTTEALVAIDVNSGKSRKHEDAEEAAYKTNLEAAEEIARQLRLRDLGGLIICDFIDMRADRHRRAVEKAVRDYLKKHKERAQVLRMSRFGIIEITRQRQGPALSHSVYHDCPYCKGSGLVKTPESMTLSVMRLLQLATHRNNIHAVNVAVSSEVAYELLNRKRRDIGQLESATGKKIAIRANDGVGLDRVDFECFDAQGRAVKFLQAGAE
jgi:ribonuclease E